MFINEFVRQSENDVFLQWTSSEITYIRPTMSLRIFCCTRGDEDCLREVLSDAGADVRNWLLFLVRIVLVWFRSDCKRPKIDGCAADALSVWITIVALLVC